jgi:hypothetical protein
MRCGGKGDAIPLLIFQDAPPFKAGSFTLIQIVLGVVNIQDRIIPVVDMRKRILFF